ncbi:MAG TPA: hypothetical protein PLW68_06230 [Casimicrobiaceae bacterium]|nr:hypothetical protein [Casimicrobiaceae bacterium]
MTDTAPKSVNEAIAGDTAAAILNSISLFIGYRATLTEAVSDIKFIR